MKTISTILAAILCSSSPLLAQDEKTPVQSEQTSPKEAGQKEIGLGKENISIIRSAYQKGEYAEFLKEMDDAYQSARSDNRLSSLADTRVVQFPEMKDAEKWEERAAILQKEKNQELLAAVSDEDDSVFARKVRSATAHLSTPEQEKAGAQLSLFHFMAPNSGKTADENKLIDLDLEYEFKVLHLSRPNSGIPADEQRVKHYVLRMEKMDKAVEMAKGFQDASLKQALGLSAANFDERLAQNWDVSDLNALAKGRIKPSSALEEKVASILFSHQAKFNDQFKQYLDSQSVAEK